MPRRQQGNGEVAALYAAHRLTLVRLAVLLGRDPGVAESIVQRSFLRLLRRSRHGVDPSDALAALRRSVVVATRSAQDPHAAPRPSRTLVGASAAGPDAPLRAPHATLARRQREAVVLGLYEGLSDRQVGRVLGASDAAALNLRRDAVTALARDDESPEETEERLAQSLHDTAEHVTAADLRSTFADVEAEDELNRDRRRRVARYAVAAVAVVGLVVTGAWLAGQPRTVDAEPSPSPTTTSPTTSAGPDTTPLSSPALAPGERPRTAIPWATVGAGWVAVATAAPADAVSATLLLVSPEGTRYVVGTSPDGMTLQDISPDGRKVLVAIGSEAYEWDLAVGTSRRLGSAYGWKTMHYAGMADVGYLVLWTDNTSQLRLEHRLPDGRLKMEYPIALAPTAGSPGTPATVISADGHSAFVASRDGGVLVIDLATDAVGTIQLPPGSEGCEPRDRAEGNAVLVVCRTGPDPVLLTSADASAPVPVPGAPDRVVGAWQSSLGTLVQRGDTECATDLVLISSAGALTRPTPTGPGAGLVPNQTVGDTLLLGGTRCATDGSRLAAYDLRTGSSTELTGENAGGRAVRQAVLLRPIG